MLANIINAGCIELSEKVIVSDPCYDRSVWCMATDVAVKPGKYVVYIAKKDEKEFGTRVAVIMAVHEDYIKEIKEDWETYDCCIGVDSGQCGIFDDDIYPKDEKSGGEYDDENSFYGECCKLTLGDSHFGLLRNGNGVVSSSGYGDGSYELFCQYYDGERIALMVDFNLDKNITIMKEIINSQHG